MTSRPKEGRPKKPGRPETPRRLPFATGGSACHLSPRFDWPRLEKAYGRRFTSEQRQEIEHLVRDFLRREPLEKAAPFERDFDAWLREAEEAAKQMRRLFPFMSPPDGDKQTIEAARYGLSQMLVRGPKEFAAALEFAVAYLPSAVAAVAEAPRSPGIAEGDNWRRLVLGLTRLFKEWGLPIGAANDTDTKSPFVAFFFELQESVFPKTTRRHHTTPALAKAINKARGEATGVTPARKRGASQRSKAISDTQRDAK